MKENVSGCFFLNTVPCGRYNLAYSTRTDKKKSPLGCMLSSLCQNLLQARYFPTKFLLPSARKCRIYLETRRVLVPGGFARK